MTAPDIFLSYNREDAAVARLYADAFAGAGLNVWWDATLRSGEAYDKVTEAALRGAKAVVVLWSPRSVESRWVRAEATVADRNGTLLPVAISFCERPVMFELTQTADLTHWRGAADDKAWLTFLDDVRRMVGRSEPKPVEAVPVSAPDPAVPDNKLPLVAVVPFTHRGTGDEMEFLAEDLVEEITRQMAQRPFFDTIGAGKMVAWRGRAIDYGVLKRELGVRYVTEGKLQRSGDEVRLTVQLLNADTARMVWSSRVVRKLTDIATSPEKFAVAIAADLSEHIIQIEVSRAMAKPGPYSAWEHMLRARAYIARQGSDSVRRCIEELRRAVAAAPDIAFAHAFLACELAELAFTFGEKLDDARRHEIQAHVTRAMQLDGDNPAIITMISAAYHGLGEDEACLRLTQRALELHPNYMGSMARLGMAYVFLGRTADAIATFTQQDRHTPFDAVRFMVLTFLGVCYLLEGQPDEAKEALDRALAVHPEYLLALKWKAIVTARRGEETEAIATIRRLREVEPAISIDQHVWEIMQHPKFAARTIEEVAILRRLWNATDSGA